MGHGMRTQAEEIGAHAFLPFLDAPLHTAFVMPIRTEFQWAHDVWEFCKTQSMYKVSM